MVILGGAKDRRSITERLHVVSSGARPLKCIYSEHLEGKPLKYQQKSDAHGMNV